MAEVPTPAPSTGSHPASSQAHRFRPSMPKRPPRKPSADRPGVTEVTRAGVIWVAVSAGLVILVLLIVFILQNQDRVTVHYFGAVGELSLGMAMFIAAVAGGILVAIAGATRILQLRNQRRHPPALPSGPTTDGQPEPTSGS